MTQLTGDENNNNLSGENGNDYIQGLGGNDTLWGGEGGRDRIYGGDGDDLIVDGKGDAVDILNGGAGIDTLSMFYGTFFGGGIGAFEFTFTPGARMITPGGSKAVGFEKVSITGSDFNDTITGGKFADFLRGWQGDDWLDGGKGADFMVGDNGNDTLYGGKGDDTVQGNGNSDVLFGGDGDDFIRGGASFDVFQGDDTICGGNGADLLWLGPNTTLLLYDTSDEGVYLNLRQGLGYGGEAQGDTITRGVFGRVHLVGSAHDDYLIGGDTIDGGAGDDRLQASQETFNLIGGDGADLFIVGFDGATIWEVPLIGDYDHAEGDLIDLHLIDARHRIGDQAFVFIGTAAFSGEPGEARYEFAGGRTVIQLNMNHDDATDFTILLEGEHTLTAADFVL